MHLREGDDGLAGPGGAGLTVAGEFFDAEDAADVVGAALFAADELGDAVEEAGFGQILGGGGVDGVEVGVVADVVLLEGGDDVGALALLEDAGFFTDHFEGGGDIAFREKLGDAEGSIIVGGENVVLGVEPEDDVDSGLFGLILCEGGDGEDHEQNEADVAGHR